MIPALQARLRDAMDTPFALVEGATSLAQVKDRPPALPAAYVIPLREASSENSRATGGILQRTEVDIGVVIVLENLSDYQGAAAGDDLEALKGWVRRRLVGFVPAEDHDAIEHVSGELIKARSGTVWWQVSFATAFSQEDEEDTP